MKLILMAVYTVLLTPLLHGMQINTDSPLYQRFLDDHQRRKNILKICFDAARLDKNNINLQIPIPALQVNGGITPLGLSAASDNNLSITKELLKLGAMPNAVDDNYITPLYYAIQNNARNTISLLIHYGANPFNADPQGNTIIYLAGLTHAKTKNFVYKKYAYRMLLLCSLKECLVRDLPKDLLKLIVEQIG